MTISPYIVFGRVLGSRLGKAYIDIVEHGPGRVPGSVRHLSRPVPCNTYLGFLVSLRGTVRATL